MIGLRVRKGGCLLLLLAVAGCQGVTIDPASWRTYRTKDPAVYEQYGLTPAEKIDQIRDLARSASSFSSGEQSQYVMLLSQKFESEPDDLLRLEIVRAIGAFREIPAPEILESAIVDADREIRIAACESLAGRGDMQAIELLSQALANDADLDVRLAAASGLDQHKTGRAITALGDALSDRDPALQRRAIASLRSISGEDFGSNVQAWQQYAQGEHPTLSESPEQIAQPWWVPWPWH